MKTIFSRRQKGATLLELMLVLAISGTALVFGIKLYQSYQTTFQLQQLKYNVDQLFEATANYYQANCGSGALAPNPPWFLTHTPGYSGSMTYPPAATDVYPVSINSALLPTGYLDNWSPNNPNVDPSAGEGGYVVQLNPIVSTAAIPVSACVVLHLGQPCIEVASSNSSIPTTQAQIVTWVVQVAVKISSNSNIRADDSILGADCMSGSSAPGTVDPCSAGNNSQQYLVWQRVPTVATMGKSSVFTSSMPLLKQNNLLYTTDSNYEFNSGYSTTTTPPQAPVYYLCGG